MQQNRQQKASPRNPPPCNLATTPQGRELREHGTALFPAACYYDHLAEDAVPWHWHDELEVVFIERGAAIVAADNQRYTVTEGNGFFINAGILHGVWDAGNTGCRLHSIVFHPRLVGGGVDSIFWQGYLQPLLSNPGVKYVAFPSSQPWSAAACQCIQEAWTACALEQPGYEFQVRSLLSQVIFEITAHCSLERTPPAERTLRNDMRIKTMLQYVQDHYGEELTTEGIARSAAISRSECLRCFRNMIGTTPIQYVKAYRIQKAAELLRTTDRKIADIGLLCGFQEMSYFAKAFRERKGRTPSQYRAVGPRE